MTKEEPFSNDKLRKREERWKRWKEHCKQISEKVKTNEIRRQQSEEYAKHRYSD